MEFKLVFKKPYSISMSAVQDDLVIDFFDSFWLLTNRNHSQETTLTTQHRFLSKKIRKQMGKNGLSEGFVDVIEKVKTFLYFILITMIVLSMLPLNGNRGHIFILFIRALSIIVHTPILQVVLPGNVVTFIGHIIKVVMFDVLELTNFWEKQQVFQFEDHEVDLLDQLKNAGYDSASTILILQTLSVIVILYWL